MGSRYTFFKMDIFDHSGRSFRSDRIPPVSCVHCFFFWYFPPCFARMALVSICDPFFASTQRQIFSLSRQEVGSDSPVLKKWFTGVLKVVTPQVGKQWDGRLLREEFWGLDLFGQTRLDHLGTPILGGAPCVCAVCRGKPARCASSTSCSMMCLPSLVAPPPPQIKNFIFPSIAESGPVSTHVPQCATGGFSRLPAGPPHCILPTLYPVVSHSPTCRRCPCHTWAAWPSPSSSWRCCPSPPA